MKASAKLLWTMGSHHPGITLTSPIYIPTSTSKKKISADSGLHTYYLLSQGFPAAIPTSYIALNFPPSTSSPAPLRSFIFGFSVSGVRPLLIKAWNKIQDTPPAIVI